MIITHTRRALVHETYAAPFGPDHTMHVQLLSVGLTVMLSPIARSVQGAVVLDAVPRLGIEQAATPATPVPSRSGAPSPDRPYGDQPVVAPLSELQLRVPTVVMRRLLPLIAPHCFDSAVRTRYASRCAGPLHRSARAYPAGCSAAIASRNGQVPRLRAMILKPTRAPPGEREVAQGIVGKGTGARGGHRPLDRNRSSRSCSSRRSASDMVSRLRNAHPDPLETYSSRCRTE